MLFGIHFTEKFKIGSLMGHVKPFLNLVREKWPEIDIRLTCCVSC